MDDQTLMSHYDEVLSELEGFGPDHRVGSSHAPMALEALEHQDRVDLYAPFLVGYRTLLEPRDDGPSVVLEAGEWEAWAKDRLPALVPAVAAMAGHGLLRVAHALRALQRADTPPRRAELVTAVDYWGSRPLELGPDSLDGTSTWDEVAAELPRMQRDPDGSITANLRTVAATGVVAPLVATLAPTSEPISDRLDRFALAAGGAMVAQENPRCAFALLHGVTVSTMARVLLDYLDPAHQLRLEAAVAGFVASAVVVYDESGGDAPSGGATTNVEAGGVAALAVQLEDRLDAHDIKLADALVGLAQRHPDQDGAIQEMASYWLQL